MDASEGGSGRSGPTLDGVAVSFQRVNAEHDPLKALRTACEEVAKTEPGDIQRIAALHASMILDYYRDVRKQAQQSFIAALVAAVVGTLFFLYAAWSISHAGSPWSNISLIAGAVIQVISAINFYLYFRASRQFAMFHVCLERTNRFLLANSMAENLICRDRRDEARAQLIDLIANAPMLAIDMTVSAQNRSASRTRNRDAGGRKKDPRTGKRKDTWQSGRNAELSATATPARDSAAGTS